MELSLSCLLGQNQVQVKKGLVCRLCATKSVHLKKEKRKKNKKPNIAFANILGTKIELLVT